MPWSEILHSLELYAVQHFTEEELFMASFHYPHFDKHILLHQHFIQKITDEKERVTKGANPAWIYCIFYGTGC